MRSGFIRALVDIAARDERIWLLTADLGYSVLERFRDAYSDRFINVGVSEQSMIGVAAGLALSGKQVFTYSIGNFGTLRCLEQIRVDVCYQRANVKIVSVGGGYAYGALGVTHHATEELSALRALPNMIVVAPADPIEAELAVHALAGYDGPAYLRLGKAGDPTVHERVPTFSLGRAITVRQGSDASLVGTGGILPVCVEAAHRLAEAGVSARVLSMHTLKPLDEVAIAEAAQETRAVVTVEEHTIIGGLGSAVAEALAESGANVPFRRLGVRDAFADRVGDQAYLRRRAGLDADSIAAHVIDLLRPRVPSTSA